MTAAPTLSVVVAPNRSDAGSANAYPRERNSSDPNQS